MDRDPARLPDAYPSGIGRLPSARSTQRAVCSSLMSSPCRPDWDLAAADLLVHEAGGLFTDISGATLRYIAPLAEHGALLAAGKARHRALIGALRDRRGEFA